MGVLFRHSEVTEGELESSFSDILPVLQITCELLDPSSTRNNDLNRCKI